jgi:hypothetical protein
MSQQFNASPDKLTGAVNIVPPTSKLLLTAVAVEKLGISGIGANLGDRKCPGDPRRSFIGHPRAILFLANFSGVSF